MFRQLRQLVLLILSDRGQTMAEYAVVIGIITVSVVATIGALSGAIVTHLGGIAKLIEGLPS